MEKRGVCSSSPTWESDCSKEPIGPRRKLLEAAGQVFADKGYDRATGKEICERAGIHSAAINYYFGGMEGLYRAVVQEARHRLVPLADLEKAVADKGDALARLRAVLARVAGTIATMSSWAARVLAREIVAPSPVLGSFPEEELLPRARLLKKIVSELMGLPIDHPAVDRGCLSAMAPCSLLLIADRRFLQRAFPHFGFGPEDTDAVGEHLARFALAGLSQCAKEVVPALKAHPGKGTEE